MNLLHQAMLSQQQRRSSKHIICPACELPALFTFYQDDQIEQTETWQCGNCQALMPLSEPWPVAPLARVSPRGSERSVLIPMLVEDSHQFDLAQMA
jgi:Zn ribbon nucleic-acid-binding protein